MWIAQRACDLLEGLAAGLTIIMTLHTDREELNAPTALLVPAINATKLRAAINRLSGKPDFFSNLNRLAHGAGARSKMRLQSRMRSRPYRIHIMQGNRHKVIGTRFDECRAYNPGAIRTARS